MNIKKFLQPSIPKLLVSLFIGIFYLYFAKESISAAGFGFAFFYETYGFPFQYLITGDTSGMSGISNDMFLGNYFTKYGSVLFNPAALALDIFIIYFISCLIGLLITDMKVKRKEAQQ